MFNFSLNVKVLIGMYPRNEAIYVSFPSFGFPSISRGKKICSMSYLFITNSKQSHLLHRPVGRPTPMVWSFLKCWQIHSSYLDIMLWF